ncbi:MAG TPA: M20 family metallopeptidase [Dehalococcoidia bacterium]|nr:M20 family metallopeptidase [Dehalococcoidia bacterium]
MTDAIEAAKARARAAVEHARHELIRISREIHVHPELAFNEHHAVAQLVPFLEAAGFTVHRGVYGLETAFRGEWGHGPATIAICAEYDALPEIGHACGHNLIATAGVGAAIALVSAIDPAEARVVILGTPAEETRGGKIIMANQGCFDDLDVAMMAHPMAIDFADPPMLGVAHVDVEYRGRAAHASVAPEQGLNALDAMVTAYQAVAQLRQHIRRDARLHGIITYGGAAANIVPDRATGTFYVRAMQPAYLKDLKERVRHCFEAGALATGCELTTDWHEALEYQPLRSNRPLVEAYRRNGEALGKQFVDLKNVSTGSTDMGNVSQIVPSIHPTFGVGQMIFNHTPEFTAAAATDAAHESMLLTAQALAMTGVDLALDPALLRRVKEDFAATR